MSVPRPTDSVADTAYVGPLMEKMTWPAVRDAATAGLPVILPVGSTEQHGPHLPLKTDCEIPRAIAERAARHRPLIIAPTVGFGAKSRPLSGGGETFPGTLSLRATTLIAVLEDILAGLVRTGFQRICVQNWHYENGPYLWEAADLVSTTHEDARFLILDDPVPGLTDAELHAMLGPDFGGWPVEHAALAETSLMLAIAPELVVPGMALDDRAGHNPGWEVIPTPTDRISSSGVLWRASRSTAEAGERLLDAAAGCMVRALNTEFPRSE
jgi:creatinine amidohydrolase